MKPGPKILVVDDEKVVRMSFGRVLSESGCHVDTAVDGNAALARVAQEAVDIAFVDLKMPGMDGMEVVRRIRRTRPSTRCVVVTGFGTSEARREAEELGVTAFLSKPITPEELTQLTSETWRMIVDEREMAVAQPRGPVDNVIPLPAAGTSAAATAGTGAAEVPEGRPIAPRAPRFAAIKGVSLLVAAPLLGLAYVVFVPVIGLGMVGWVAVKKLLTWRIGRRNR
ncbi:MAG: response regulator [Candidatus Schekmanbacteria bacterium]|nr:response regulator [Candidatus Schekmanbacteria bacterium]